MYFFTTFCAFFYNRRAYKCNINGLSRFNGKESFGENVNFNGCQVYGKGRIIFGNNFHSAAGLKILTSFHNYKGSRIPYDQTIVTKDVVIEDNVWIGLNVIILGGVTIGEGAIVQAGSVVSRSIPPLALAGGNPAVEFKKRDREHYFQLKESGSFL